MIRVSVTLISAIDGSQKELARMDIINDGVRSCENFRYGNYQAKTYIGRDKNRLDKLTVSKFTEINNWPRLNLHVWNLVTAALNKMGYGKP